MRKNKILESLVGLLLLIAILPLVSAQTELSESAGITPDSFLYQIDRFFEDVSLFLTFNEESKARVHITIAEERIAELNDIFEKGKLQFVLDLRDNYNKHIERSNYIAQNKLDLIEKREEISTLIAESTMKHIKVLDNVYERVPLSAKSAILHAKEVSVRGNQQAIGTLSRTDPKRASELTLLITKDQLLELQEAKDDDDSEAIKKISEDFADYIVLSEEIVMLSEINQQDQSIVIEIIKRDFEEHENVINTIISNETLDEDIREKLAEILKKEQEIEQDEIISQRQVKFIRGDVNQDKSYDVQDAVFILTDLFGGGASSDCMDAGDVNDDGTYTIADALYILINLRPQPPQKLPPVIYVDLSGVQKIIDIPVGEPGQNPPQPYPECGIDPTPDALGCKSFIPCA